MFVIKKWVPHRFVSKGAYMLGDYDWPSLGFLWAFGGQNVVMEVAYEVYIIMEWKNIRLDAHPNLFLFLLFLYILVCYLKQQYLDMPPLTC